MKEVNILGKGAVCRFPSHLFGYTAWPSIERLPDGTLIAVASGMRMGHLCFCGKTVMYVSRDDGNTWAGPTVINDTPLDDRDAGILWLGGRKLLLTWFNLETKYLAAYRGARDEMTPQQRAIVDAMTLHYSDAVDEKWAGSFCRLSEDGGVTWKEPHRLPVTAPHGPARLRDGRLLILGKDFKNKEPSGDGGAIYACASSDEGVTWETLSSIPLPDGTHNNNYFEPHVIELPDGKLVGHIRYQHWAAYHKFQPFTIFQTESSDGGRTWTEARPLGCCGSPPHLLLHSSGALVCTYGRREAPLGESAMVSWDGGKNWQLDYSIDATAPSGDLGYPASVEMADHSILTVYYQKPEKDELCTLMYTRWELPRKKG